jgi:hypothetical protein
MISRIATSSCLALSFIMATDAAEPLATHEFSAEVVQRDAAGTAAGPPAKIYVRRGKVRIETPQAPDGFFLVGAADTALFVRPAQRIFMDAKQSTLLTQVFVPIDPSNPCPQWQVAARDAGAEGAGLDWRCERIETPVAEGRGTVLYRVQAADRQSRQWVDASLEFPVKLRAADGTTLVLEHIRVEPQPSSLFDLPSNYRKLDPRTLIERVKHSDVWAAPEG